MKNRYVSRDSLGIETRREMFELIRGYFDGVEESKFIDDLNEKDGVVLLEEDERVLGFTTLRVFDSEHNEDKIKIVYSGDTIVHQEYRNSTQLSSCWLAFMDQLAASSPDYRVYWLLICSGFRTYRFMPVFWKEFYPSFNMEMPPDLKMLLDQTAHSLFGNEYNSDTGIVTFENPQVLKNGEGDIAESRRRNSHVAYFESVNPGHILGDELVCIAEVSRSNQTKAGERVYKLSSSLDFVSNESHQKWKEASLPDYDVFNQSMDSVTGVQNQRLLEIIQSNVHTQYGRKYKFETIRSYEDFRDLVPITGYDDYSEYIASIATGEQGVLTESDVDLFMPSSGSSSAMKLIPCTEGFMRELRKAINPWVYDMFDRYPRLMKGKSYWSISPSVHIDAGKSVVPIAFDDDSSYFGDELKSIVESTLAVPSAIKDIRDSETFRYVTLYFLLKEVNLRFISIWHPSFLTLLLSGLRDSWDSLVRDIRCGTLNPPQRLEDSMRDSLNAYIETDSNRADALKFLSPDDVGRIWPELTLISCWADGLATYDYLELKRMFPDVPVERKGLLATEAFISIPFKGKNVLAYQSHFYEFMDEEGNVRLSDQLTAGAIYKPVITTSGGLYRYMLGDLIRVDGFMRSVPCLSFVGKDDYTLDYYGEKVNAGFVSGVINALFEKGGVEPRFAMIGAENIDGQMCYVLYVQSDSGIESNLAERLEAELSGNPHYEYCVRLGQLGLSRVYLIANGASEAYVNRMASEGIKLGDIKPVALSKLSKWSDYFEGSFNQDDRNYEAVRQV